MTRDEHRAQCIEAMAVRYVAEFRKIWCGSRPAKIDALRLMTAAFDSLHGIAFVVPIEATVEMVSVELNDLDCTPIARDLLIIFDAMAAAGNLTEAQNVNP